MDLGVVLSESLAHETTTRSFLGTITYAAPEYLLGEGFTAAADVYSLGAVAYELATRKSFYGDSPHWAKVIVRKLTSSQQQGDPPDLELGASTLRALTNASDKRSAHFLVKLISSMLDHDPSERPELSSVVECWESEIWRTAHYDIGSTFIHGYPKARPRSQALVDRYALPEAVPYWHARCTRELWTLLLQIAEHTFHSGYKQISSSRGKRRLAARLAKMGLIETSWGERTRAIAHQNVVLAYRDNLLEDYDGDTDKAPAEER